MDDLRVGVIGSGGRGWIEAHSGLVPPVCRRTGRKVWLKRCVVSRLRPGDVLSEPIRSALAGRPVRRHGRRSA